MSERLKISKKFFLKGINYIKIKDFHKAEIYFLKSYELTPERFSIINNLLQIYIQSENVNKLESFLNKIDNKFYSETDVIIANLYLLFFKKEYNYVFKKIENLKNNLKNNKKFLQFEIRIRNELHQYEEVENIYKKLIKLNPENISDKLNYCLFLKKIGKNDLALKLLYQLLEAEPDETTLNKIKYNISFIELRNKNFIKGFNFYNPRFETEFDYSISKIKELVSEDTLLKETKKIIIWGDQGYGDMINFFKYAIYIINKFNITINIVFPKKIYEIFLNNIDQRINLFLRSEIDLNKFNYQLRLSCIPKIVKNFDLKKINYKCLNKIESDIILQNKIPNIGLCWSGSKIFNNKKLRDPPFKMFERLLCKNIQFYKLQQSIDTTDKKIMDKFNNIIDLGDKNFKEIAKYMLKMDLIISSDTSIIHLAGALEVNSILLLNYSSDWRWFNENEKTFWYPSVRIIKQKAINSWASVFNDLDNFIEKNFIKD